MIKCPKYFIFFICFFVQISCFAKKPDIIVSIPDSLTITQQVQMHAYDTLYVKSLSQEPDAQRIWILDEGRWILDAGIGLLTMLILTFITFMFDNKKQKNEVYQQRYLKILERGIEKEEWIYMLMQEVNDQFVEGRVEHLNDKIDNFLREVNENKLNIKKELYEIANDIYVLFLNSKDTPENLNPNEVKKLMDSYYSEFRKNG